MAIQHPLKIGTRIRTIGGSAQGNWDSYDDEETGENIERHCKPGEIGIITDNRGTSDGHNYSVTFYPSNVWNFLAEDEVEDAALYEILPPIEDDLEEMVSSYVGVMEDYDAGYIKINNPDHPHHEDWTKAKALLEWLHTRRLAEQEG